PADSVAVLTEWVKMGAPWPVQTAKVENDSWKKHWAFRPVQSPPIPPGGGEPIDAFVRAKLTEKGMSPNPPADRPTLVRRLFIDLIGLPPTPEKADAFVNDPAPDAVEKLVDRLLASPHFGERWGRYWLDLARYADNRGYVGVNVERTYPYA